jgi:hypothetical protein
MKRAIAFVLVGVAVLAVDDHLDKRYLRAAEVNAYLRGSRDALECLGLGLRSGEGDWDKVATECVRSAGSIWDAERRERELGLIEQARAWLAEFSK